MRRKEKLPFIDELLGCLIPSSAIIIAAVVLAALLKSVVVQCVLLFQVMGLIMEIEAAIAEKVFSAVRMFSENKEKASK